MLWRLSVCIVAVALALHFLYFPDDNMFQISRSKRRLGILTRHFTQGVDSTQNPLLQVHRLPPFSRFSPSQVEPAITTLLENYLGDVESLEQELIKNQKSNNHSQVWSFLDDKEKFEQRLGDSWGMVNHLKSVKQNEEIRAAHAAVQPKVIEVFTRVAQSLPILEECEYMRNTPTIWNSLNRPQQRIVESAIKDMKNSGVALKGQDKARFNEIETELGQLSSTFSNNLLDATKAWTKEITDKNMVEGFPPSLLAMTAQAAGETATAEDGPWKLTLDGPVLMGVLKHAKNRSLRHEIYMAHVTKAGDSNAPVLADILKLKKEKAGLLGYECHADLSLGDKMAGSVDAVNALTGELHNSAYPAAVKEFDKLCEFAVESGFSASEKLKNWDTTYYSERQRERLFNYTEEELRPYFSLQTVLNGLFELTERLFDVSIVQVDVENEQIDLWHEDCLFFNVVSSGNVIASFYLDPYSRPAEKNGGAWMNVCRQRSENLGTKPVAYLVCNGTPPVKDKPSLMTFSDVTTLFHEFGHGLQHMLTEVPYSAAAGIYGVEWDAVELPSQFMENWCYHKKTVDRFARHYKTGEPIPDALFEKVAAARKHNAGMAMLRQLYIGRLDMALHSNEFDPSSGASGAFAMQRKIAVDDSFTVIPPLEDDRFLCSFSHIFAGGYSAGYYSYMWAEVMSADAFAAFEEAGLDDDAAIREVGRKFRETILALGGGEHPEIVYKRFRGRSPSPKALLEHRGLN